MIDWGREIDDARRHSPIEPPADACPGCGGIRRCLPGCEAIYGDAPHDGNEPKEGWAA